MDDQLSLYGLIQSRKARQKCTCAHPFLFLFLQPLFRGIELRVPINKSANEISQWRGSLFLSFLVFSLDALAEAVM